MNKPNDPSQGDARKDAASATGSPFSERVTSMEHTAGYDLLPPATAPSLNTFRKRLARRAFRGRACAVAAGLLTCVLGAFVTQKALQKTQPSIAVDLRDSGEVNKPLLANSQTTAPAEYRARLIVPTLVPVVEVVDDTSTLVGWSLEDIELPIDPNKLAPTDQHEIHQVLFEPSRRRGIEL